MAPFVGNTLRPPLSLGFLSPTAGGPRVRTSVDLLELRSEVEPVLHREKHNLLLSLTTRAKMNPTKISDVRTRSLEGM